MSDIPRHLGVSCPNRCGDCFVCVGAQLRERYAEAAHDRAQLRVMYEDLKKRNEQLEEAVTSAGQKLQETLQEEDADIDFLVERAMDVVALLQTSNAK